jgi:hypothetical protein
VGIVYLIVFSSLIYISNCLLGCGVANFQPYARERVLLQDVDSEHAMARYPAALLAQHSQKDSTDILLMGNGVFVYPDGSLWIRHSRNGDLLFSWRMQFAALESFSGFAN